MKDEKAKRQADSAASQTRDPGRWVLPAVSYINTERRTCAYCGRPLARRYWAQVREETERSYCDPAHADSHTTYPLSNDKSVQPTTSTQ